MKFLRQDTNKAKGMRVKWRKPRGRHSKLRLNKAGHRKKPSQGFRTPKSNRHLVSGKRIHLVNNLQDLSSLKNATILLSTKLGLKKKLEILKKAKELDLQVLNIKDTEAFIKRTTESFEKKKQKKKEKETQKKKEKEKAVKKAEETKDTKEEEKEEKIEDKTKGLPEVKEKPKDVPQKQTTQIARANAPKQK
ncbi:MAG: hypothetical protein CMH63_01145 [Nanoarchaeota archaeon]|jgi:large subunit ribosomal protein L32e|nr:hypothetical protein [Nanoarchaeota archaeon]|tara:strand:- start:23858 stop:24433 length:576 start_codon:yes stop_codon:yes gene_type:complete